MDYFEIGEQHQQEQLGTVTISDHVIQVIAGSAAISSYGVVGMAARKQVKDNIAGILGRENLSRGIEVRRVQDELHIDLYIIVAYGTKVVEVASNIQHKVKYVLEEVTGLQIDSVNVLVQGIRVLT